MANINIIETCNYRCKYCFAEEFTECGEEKKMSVETFKEALNFVANTQSYVGIIGGEPTLHPQFGEILDEAIKDNRITKVLVFTNGTNLYKFIDRFANSKVSILINYNAPYEIIRQHGEVQGNRLMEKVKKDIIKTRKIVGDRISVGVNIFDNNTDWSHVIDILESADIRILRVSTVAPNAHNRDNFNLTYYGSYVESFVSLLDAVKDHVAKVVFDCSLPPICTLGQYTEKLKELEEYYSNRGSKFNMYSCNICEPVIDITPDLEVIRCFSMSRYKKMNMYDFNSVEEINDYYKKDIDGICYNIKTNFLCDNCDLSERKVCNGGCMSFTLEKAKIVKNFIEGI